MQEDLMLAGVSGATGALALLLTAMRFSAARRTVLRSARAWMKANTRTAAAGLLTMSALAIASGSVDRASLPDPLSQLSVNSNQGVYALLAEAPGAAQVTEATGSNPADAGETSRKEKALAALRDFASRMEEKRAAIAGIGSDSAVEPTTPGLPDVETMMGRLRTRLKDNPSDLKGWMTLAWAYANTGQYGEAVTAYETAMKLDGGNAEIKLALDDLKNKATAAGKPVQ